MASCRAVVNFAPNLWASRDLIPWVVASIAAVVPIVGDRAELASQLSDTPGVKFVTGTKLTCQMLTLKTK